MKFISALILSVLGLGGIPLLFFARSIDDSIAPTNIQLSAGDATRTIAVGEDKRRYRVFVPQSYSAKTPTPVVLVFHGGEEILRE